MKLAIRKASPIDDRAEMLGLLQRNLPDSQLLAFDWRHLRNPAGKAWSWFVYEEGSGRAVAMASLFPRQMYVDGMGVLAGQIMNFVVDSDYRSLGPAVMLQRATLAPADSGEVDFYYDCPPHDQGMSTFVRLRMSPNCEVTRYALLLRSDEYFEKRMRSGVLAKPVRVAANVILGMRGAVRIPRGLEVSQFNSAFGEEFSALDGIISTAGIVTRRRSAEELNWRYRENPENRFQVWVARRGGELMAFLVFFIQPCGVAAILELFGRELSEVGAPLLGTVVESCRGQKLSAVHGYCSEDSELKPILEKLGFSRRERAARVVAYAKPSTPLSHSLSGNGLRWSFSRAELSG